MSVKLYDRLPLNQGVVLDLPLLEGTGALTQDISRYHNNGVFGAGAAAPTWVQLPSGIWVLSCDGADYLNCGAAANLNLTTEVSLENWVNASVGGGNAILSKWEAYEFRVRADNGFAMGSIWVGAANRSVVGITDLRGAGWKHEVFTYDGANLSIYVQGNLEDSQPQIGNIDVTGTNLLFGVSFIGAGYFLGSLGRPRVYTKALSDAEVAARFQENRGFYGV